MKPTPLTAPFPERVERAPAIRTGRVLSLAALALVVAILVVAAQNVVLTLFFPRLSRVATDFSPAYLRRELSALAASPPQAVFFGDSVLWGYALPAQQNAVTLLRSRPCDCVNLAFKSGNPADFYALALLFKEWGVRPKTVILQINQRVFNPADATDHKLHPAIAELVAPLLTAEDRTALELPAPPAVPPAPTARERFEAWLTSASVLYAMRSDIRETVFEKLDELPSKPLTAADFEGTYDLEALDSDNTAVYFLTKTVALLRAQNIPVVAFMTPTNHGLIPKTVGDPAYQGNKAYLTKLLERHGVRVLDLDAALPSADFIDNDHLTAEGQRKLASLLQGALPQ